MNETKRHQLTNANIQEKSQLLWNIADTIRGLYKPHEYDVILPFTVIKRFHDTLYQPDRQYWMSWRNAKTSRWKTAFCAERPDMSSTTRVPYFRHVVVETPRTLSRISVTIWAVTDNVQDVLSNFEMDTQVTKLAKNGKLFQVIQDFNTDKGYMGADKISSTDMGYIFEDLVKRFSWRSYNEDIGTFHEQGHYLFDDGYSDCGRQRNSGSRRRR